MNFIILNLKNEVQNTINHVKENNKITKNRNNNRAREVKFGLGSMVVV